MKCILNIKENRQFDAKIFQEDGNIEEGEYINGDKLINGLRWKLKNDGTYDKYTVKREVSKEDGGFGEVIETFICNEGLEWMLVNYFILLFKIYN